MNTLILDNVHHYMHIVLIHYCVILICFETITHYRHDVSFVSLDLAKIFPNSMVFSKILS